MTEQVRSTTEPLRLAAFTTDPAGGNPAGVWLGSLHPDPAEMLASRRMSATRRRPS